MGRKMQLVMSLFCLAGCGERSPAGVLDVAGTDVAARTLPDSGRNNTGEDSTSDTKAEVVADSMEAMSDGDGLELQVSNDETSSQPDSCFGKDFHSDDCLCTFPGGGGSSYVFPKCTADGSWSCEAACSDLAGDALIKPED